MSLKHNTTVPERELLYLLRQPTCFPLYQNTCLNTLLFLSSMTLTKCTTPFQRQHPCCLQTCFKPITVFSAKIYHIRKLRISDSNSEHSIRRVTYVDYFSFSSYGSYNQLKRSLIPFRNLDYYSRSLVSFHFQLTCQNQTQNAIARHLPQTSPSVPFFHF